MFRIYQAEIEWQSECKIIFIWHDNGEEYSSDEYINYLKKQRTKAEYTTLYTPEQNSKTECLNYSLISIIQAVMFNKKLSKDLWGKLIQTAFYLKNRLLYVNEVTSYEKIKGEKLSLSHLKVLEAWV